MRIRSFVITLTAAASLMGLTACSNDQNVNEADVSFAQEMIPHHQQATEMADLATSRTENAEVLDLAAQIKAAQQPEIDLMSGWLKDWDEEVPQGMSGMDGSMPGMMSGQEMSDLGDSSDSAFDQRFLTMMIEHHEGAIEMAETEEAKGEYANAVDLARRIQKEQAAEIITMTSLLRS